MDTICSEDIKKLIRKDMGAHVSIFMPTHHKGGLDQQDPIRLRNLIRSAEEKLTGKGLRPSEARALLKPAESLLTDNLFWRQQSEGLALFIEPNMYMYYRVPLNLREEVGVADRYYIKPLIPLLSECGLVYVLAISQNEIRLLQCTALGCVRIDLGEMPKNIEEAMHMEVGDRVVQYHSASQIGGLNAGKMHGVQTGPPSRANLIKDNMSRYLGQVNKSIINILKHESAPLVLAGVDYLHSIYHKSNTYRNLLTEGITGNPEEVGDTVLMQQALNIVRPLFDNEKNKAVSEYNKSAGTGLTAAGLKEVILAAAQGRVRFLLMAEDAQQWGTYNSDNQTVSVKPEAGPEDMDLIDLAAFHTLNHSGTIYVTKPEDLPGKTNLAAVLRF